jgi:hypothetical protein
MLTCALMIFFSDQNRLRKENDWNVSNRLLILIFVVDRLLLEKNQYDGPYWDDVHRDDGHCVDDYGDDDDDFDGDDHWNVFWGESFVVGHYDHHL